MLSAALALACGGAIDELPGYVMSDHLPLDGERKWELQSDDDGALLRVDLQAGDDEGPRELHHYDPDSGRRLLILELSSSPSEGIEVHAWREGDGPEERFDPPLRLTPSRMSQGDIHRDSAGSVALVARFTAVDVCENAWVGDAWDCVLLDVAAPDTPLDGHFELAPVYGFSVWQRVGDPAPWRLRRASYHP